MINREGILKCIEYQHNQSDLGVKKPQCEWDDELIDAILSLQEKPDWQVEGYNFRADRSINKLRVTHYNPYKIKEINVNKISGNKKVRIEIYEIKGEK